MPRHQAVHASHDLENMALSLTYYDAEGKEAGVENYDLKKLPEEIQKTAMLFGVQQAIVQRNTGTTPKERSEQANAIWQNLLTGQWARKRASSGGGPVPLVVRAIARVMKISETEAHKAYKNYPEEQRKAFQNNERVKKEMEKISKEAEGEQKQVSLDDLIGA